MHKDALMCAMETAFPILMILALVAVAAVLVLGLFALAKPGADRSRSNRIMQWRVGLQGVALVIVVLALLYAKSHG